MHGTVLKYGAQGRGLGCAGAGEDPGGGVKTWGTETPTIMLDSVFTNLLTAAFPGSTIIKILLHLPHLGSIYLVMVKFFPSNP